MNHGGKEEISPITATRALEEFCRRAASFPYLTVDTEFVGEGCYYPRLCLVQLAVAGDGPECAVAVDPLSPELSLEPLHRLFSDASVIKVFHAARQDLAIFFHKFGSLPEPVFDTQLAAMVCGYGQSIGYEALVNDIVGKQIDKSARLLDWERRPLPQKLLRYALDDVIHLRAVHLKLTERMRKLGRTQWIRDELNVLADPETYRSDPRNAWKKVKKLKNNGKYLAVLRELAAFREEYARSLNRPKNRILTDDALMHLADARPLNAAQLSGSRLLMSRAKRGELAEGIIRAIRVGVEVPRENWPRLQRKPDKPMNGAAFELMRVLLKVRSKELGVAEQVIATSDDLRRLASGDSDAKQMLGWRRDVFGNDALKIYEGRLAIAVNGQRLNLVEPKE